MIKFLGLDSDQYKRLWYAHGGFRGAKPIRPLDQNDWQPGMQCHWQEETRAQATKRIAIRIASLLHIAIAVVYLQYRARHTIGIFELSRRPGNLSYQIIFFILEALSIFPIVFRLFELWTVVHRNCVEFKRIPNHLIQPYFKHSASARVPPQFCNYPSIGVFIPCYNEDVELVAQTVISALNLDYPRQLLTVYLCDDGKDPQKRALISQLHKKFPNVHYVIRPQHTHAKAGNLNYAIERTSCDLIVTLDADFVARPFMLQRLLPYYFVWNPTLGIYEFNQTLASVQTPQHFRNLSPYDSDPLDQRSIIFFDQILPGKDYFNVSPLIGTTNLLSRAALKAIKYYPYISITEDSAISIKLHSHGYRTYYVNESLASGLATTSLWSNLRQRSRWLKGDFQILFSRHGPLSAPNLSIIQRIVYLNMTFSRFMSLVFIFYDLSAVLLLVFGLAPLDVPFPYWFLGYMAAYTIFGSIHRFILNMGSSGLEKSESACLAFEAIFRYPTLKGLILALFRADMKFKVTEKTVSASQATAGKLDEKSGAAKPTFAQRSKDTVLGESSAENSNNHIANGGDAVIIGAVGDEDEVCLGHVSEPPPVVLEVLGNNDRDTGHGNASTTDQSDLSSEEDHDRSYKQRLNARTAEERAERRRDIFKNLRRVHFNALMSAVLIFSIVWGVIRPPPHTAEGRAELFNGECVRFEYNNLLPIGLALGFAVTNVLPHLLAIYLCFCPYIQGWMMTDLKYGRCDQWAVHPKTGKFFVPASFISLLSIARTVIITGAVAIVIAITLKVEDPFNVVSPENCAR